MEKVAQYDYKWLDNPEVFAVNRLEAHSDHYQGKKQCLNGSWYFQYAKNLAGSCPVFQELKVDAKSWATITVPGHFELEG